MSQLNLCCCSTKGSAPLELLVQHPWCRYVDEDGPENMTGLLRLAKLIVFGRWGQEAAFPGLWQHSEEHGGVSGASECDWYVKDGFGLMAERWYHRETTVSERLQN